MITGFRRRPFLEHTYPTLGLKTFVPILIPLFGILMPRAVGGLELLKTSKFQFHWSLSTITLLVAISSIWFHQSKSLNDQDS